MDLTPEALQNISVKVVSSYMLKQACLSEAIANEAKDLELNPDQIKRVIEASNTVAYLRLLGDAPNRSDLEFPVATYTDVMGRMVLPDQPGPVISKTAGNDRPTLKNPLDADDTETQINSSITEQEKQAMLVKETLRIKQTLAKMAEEGYVTASILEKAAANFVKDPLAFEKLAHVVAREDLRQLVVLCKMDLNKEASEGSVFRNEDLKDAITLNSLFKEARTMVLDYKQKEEFVKRASKIILEKKSTEIDTRTKTMKTWDALDKHVTGPVMETAGKGLGAAIGYPIKGIAMAARGVGRGAASMFKGVEASNAAGKLMDTGFGVLGAADYKPPYPVFKTING